MKAVLAAVLAAVLTAAVATAQPRYISFVTCPIVRDTKTSPCWLAEYMGETYYLGMQGGVAQDFYPPQLNHEVLVEGLIAPGPRVCGGIPLRPVKTSVMIEINRACNTILPVEDGIEAPQRGPDRSAASSWIRSDGPDETTVFFDFDNDFLSLHSTRALHKLVGDFQQTSARGIMMNAYRGSSKLSDGTVMVEKSGIAAERAAKVQEILVGLGIPPNAISIEAINAPQKSDGATDPWSRRVTLKLKR